MGGIRLRAVVIASAVGIGLLAAPSVPALAGVTHPFLGSFGPEGPLSVEKFGNVQGIAVDQDTGDVYVYDIGSKGGAIYKFDSEGNPVNFSGLAGNVIEGVGGADEGAENEVAIDSSTGPDKGDIYVANYNASGVLIYGADGGYLGELEGTDRCGVAVDPSGSVYVSAFGFRTVSKYTPVANPVTDANETASLAGLTEVCNVAADSEGDVYTAKYNGGVTKYESSQLGLPAATGKAIDPSGGTLAVDPAPSKDDVYVDEGNRIAQYDSAGSLLGTSGESGLGALGGGSFGVAVTHSSGDLYASDNAGGVVNLYGPGAVVPDVTTGQASNLLGTSATLNGVVYPEKTSVTRCEFEYGTEPGVFPEAAPCVPAAPFTSEGAVSVEANVSNLKQGVLYYYRLVAENVNGTGDGDEQTLFTPLPVTIEGESATGVTSTSATLDAQINPGGADTTYHFEYGTEAGSYTTSAPVPNGDLGSGTSTLDPSVHLQGLTPGTTYHYRVVASNVLGPVEGPDHALPDQTFTTQPLGGGPVLPDGRAWELVSPVATLGAQVIPAPRAVIQASEDGSAISYYLTAPFNASPAGNVLLSQAISRRGPGGWSTEDIATPHDKLALVGAHQEYVFFSSDLMHGLVEPLGETPLSTEAREETPYEPTPYVRDDETGVYTPLVTPANVPPGTKFGQQYLTENGVSVVTATPDLTHVVLRSFYALTTEPVNTSLGELLYEWTAGRLKLISAVPPESTPFQIKTGSVSRDGTRVFWSTTGPDDVYMTDMTDSEVVRVNKAQGVPEPSPNEAQFQSASSDGSLVFFSDQAQLTTSPGGGLYVYDVETRNLTLVTVPLHGEDKFTGSVLGASEDGSTVYLMDRGVLSETPNAEQEKAVEGGDNLYVLHRAVPGSAEEWQPSFITALSAGDQTDWGEQNESGVFVGQTAEVSRDGRHVAFMSERSLTGYDNRDVNEETGQHADEEVYLYDAAGPRLVCASCDPTGARPSGWEEPQTVLSDPEGVWRGRWVAATLPDWTLNRPQVDGSAVLPHRPTYLTDSGRLFFNSRDALVSQDVNGVGDVYEYEPEGEGSCSGSSATFSDKSDGCVALLSGGAGPDESVFADASLKGPGGGEGEDVLFVTSDRLVSQDVGTGYAMYDAHVCSAAAACPSPVVVAPAACSTADACKSAPAPQPALFGAPASATFNGAGNLAPTPAATVKPKAKPLTRAQKLANALKACGKKPKQKRPACRKQARKRYGPIHKAKKTDRRGQS